MSATPRKRRRWPWILLGALVVLILAIVVIVPQLIDLSSHRGEIEAAIEQQTGWETSLGELGFSVLQGLVVTVGPTELRDPATPSRVSTEFIKVRAELWPLLSGQLNVKEIIVDRPVAEVVRTSPDGPMPLPLPPMSEDAEQTDPWIELAIESLSVSGGRVLLEDRTVSPATRLPLEAIDASWKPQQARLTGSAAFENEAGALQFDGRIDESMTVTLNDVQTDVLIDWLGNDLLHRGGRLGGDVVITLPAAAEGSLEATDVSLLAGSEPLDRATIEFAVDQRGESIHLASLEVRHQQVTLTGQGQLTPALDLTLEIPGSEIEPTVRAARALFPVPVQLNGPGRATATIRARDDGSGEMALTADGVLTASEVLASDLLPAIDDAKANFQLDRNGKLSIDVAEGQVAGGPLDGSAVLDQVFPPGTLELRGNLAQASFGALVGTFVTQGVDQVRGPADVDARMSIDLSAEELGLSSIGGRLRLNANDLDVPGWDLEGAIRDGLEKQLDKLGVAGELLEILSRSKRAEQAGEQVAETFERIFDSLAVDVDLDQRPWSLRSFAVAAPGLDANGNGTFDPESGAVDVRFTATLDEARTRRLTSKYPQISSLVQNDRLTLPLEVQGAMLGPKISVDFARFAGTKLGVEDDTSVGSVAKQAAQKEIDKAKDEAKAKAVEALEDKAKDLLGGLFGGRDEDEQGDAEADDSGDTSADDSAEPPSR